MLEIENQVGMLGRLLPGVEETLEDGIPLAASGRLLADADRSIAVLRQFNVGPGSATYGRSTAPSGGHSSVPSDWTTDVPPTVTLVKSSVKADVRAPASQGLL
ncbi:MAG: hypothetical protein JWR14_3584 [Caballeronia sp.]|jgi:hypothetical protein|nr:hypothetical protein [Caballeronia sp.]